ncbi:MAG: hypothetical protein P8Z33_14230, partial [Gammaproteobacteria bacterium]
MSEQENEREAAGDPAPPAPPEVMRPEVERLRQVFRDVLGFPHDFMRDLEDDQLLTPGAWAMMPDERLGDVLNFDSATGPIRTNLTYLFRHVRGFRRAECAPYFGIDQLTEERLQELAFQPTEPMARKPESRIKITPVHVDSFDGTDEKFDDFKMQFEAAMGQQNLGYMIKHKLKTKSGQS